MGGWLRKSELWLRVAAVVIVTLIALALRLRAVDLLPIDYDEDDYLLAGQQYAQAIREGDWTALTEFNYRPEHPPDRNRSSVQAGVAKTGRGAGA